ncbi:MAG: hypothetical protein ACLP29_16250 [Dissulfurispiraceae bacterium]|jgi:hypothetical protein
MKFPWQCYLRQTRLLRILFLYLVLAGAFSGSGMAVAWADDDTPTAPQDKLQPLLSPDNPAYRTPRAGEGFKTELFGQEITVQPENSRSVTAADFGVQANIPGADNRGIIPFGAVYLWRHPDDQSLFRADLVGVYNDIFWAGSSPDLGHFEWVLTFDSYTLPIGQYELVDGNAVKSEELIWGYVRPGFGLGYRQKVSPGHQDNMLAIDLTIEPGFLFFSKSSYAASNFVLPQNTFELREHLQVRLDALDRNLLSLPHNGFAAGVDLVNANRTNWKNWGLNGSETDGREYFSASGYLLGAAAVPGIDSDRHRLLGSIHGGVGSDLDRFSAPRIGGGVLTMGEEYGSTWRPLLPGSIIQEYFPKHYAVAVGEYRWEALFFTYLSFDASAGWLDRMRQTGPSLTDTTSKNDFFSSLGGRLTTGFFFDSRMQLSYNYNFSEIRSGKYGGHEILLHFSRNL